MLLKVILTTSCTVQILQEDIDSFGNLYTTLYDNWNMKNFSQQLYCSPCHHCIFSTAMNRGDNGGKKHLFQWLHFPEKLPFNWYYLETSIYWAATDLRWTVLKICSRPHEQGLLLLELNVSYCRTANCFHVFHRILHFISCLITKYEQIFRTVYVIQEMKTNNTEVYDWSDIPRYHHTELHCQRWMQASNEEHLTHVRL